MVNKVTQPEQVKSVWCKIFTPNSKWKDKDEFLDVIFWGRQLLSILMAILWAYLGLVGFFAIASFFLINTLIVYIYTIKMNDNQEYLKECVREGFLVAFGTFMIFWIILYTEFYFS